MRTLVAVVMLLASSAAAQVASVCGPGKACTVRSLLATQSTPLTTSALMCLESGYSPPRGYGWFRSQQNLSLYGYSGQSCTTPYLEVMTINPQAGALVQFPSGSVLASGGFRAPLAFASFPTCNAGTLGVQLFDSTNNVWKYCNGSSWVEHGSTTSTREYLTVSGQTAGYPSVLFGAQDSVLSHTQVKAVCVPRTAGSGTGTYSLTVTNFTTSATASFAVACASGSGSITESGTMSLAISPGDNVGMAINNIIGCSASAATDWICNITLL